MKYFSKGKLNVTTTEALQELNSNAFGQNYKDCIFIIDSTRDFVDNIHNDTQVKAFMQIMKNIRDAGGTPFLYIMPQNGKSMRSSEFAKRLIMFMSLNKKQE